MAVESRPLGGTDMAPLPGSLSCIQRYMTALTLMGNQLAHVDSSFRGKNRHIGHLVLWLSRTSAQFTCIRYVTESDSAPDMGAEKINSRPGWPGSAGPPGSAGRRRAAPPRSALRLRAAATPRLLAGRPRTAGAPGSPGE